MKTLNLIMAAVVVFATTNAQAFRCYGENGDNSIVTKGDYHYEVINKCGEPNFHQSLGGIQSDVELMHYKINDSNYRLIFRMGRLESIKFSRN